MGIGLAALEICCGSHYLGGNPTYQCLGQSSSAGTRYRFRFTLYWDCKGIAAPTSVTVYYSSVQCSVSHTFTLTPIPGTGRDITPAGSSYVSACAGNMSAYGIQLRVYEGVVDLPVGCGSDWIFYVTDCCRAADIDNLINPGATGSSLYALLDNTVTPCNNSPQFALHPQFLYCVNQWALYNPGAVDADGDSLVMELTNCRDDGTGAPHVSVVYQWPYSGMGPFPTLTGFLTQPEGLLSFIPAQDHMRCVVLSNSGISGWCANR